jgi:hypothetical protein
MLLKTLFFSTRGCTHDSTVSSESSSDRRKGKNAVPCLCKLGDGGGHMAFMTDAINAAAVAITNAAPPDMHPGLYSAIMVASNMFSS